MKNLQAKTRLILLSLIALTICISSCKKDKNEPKSDDLVGTWELTALTYDGYIDGTAVAATIKDLNNPRITFNNDGTFSGNGGTFTLVVTDKADETVKLEFPDNRLSGSGTWERDGDILRGTGLSDIYGEELNILALTATTLRLSASFQQEGTEGMSKVDFIFTRRD